MEDLERLGYGDWDGPIKVGTLPEDNNGAPKEGEAKEGEPADFIVSCKEGESMSGKMKTVLRAFLKLAWRLW